MQTIVCSRVIKDKIIVKESEAKMKQQLLVQFSIESKEKLK